MFPQTTVHIQEHIQASHSNPPSHGGYNLPQSYGRVKPLGTPAIPQPCDVQLDHELMLCVTRVWL